MRAPRIAPQTHSIVAGGEHPDCASAGRSAPDYLMTTEDAAGRLCMKPLSLVDWRCKGIGPVYIRVGGRCIRYRQSDLDAWIEANASSQAKHHA